MPRTRNALVALAAVLGLSCASLPELVGSAAELGPELLPEEVDASLGQDDECAASDAASEQCALNALQRKALRRSAPAMPPKWCGSGSGPRLWAPHTNDPPIQVKVLSYNLYWWNLFGVRHGNGDSAARLIAGNMEPPFDFMGFQECEDPVKVLGPVGLLDTYEAFLGTHALCVAYRKSTWTLIKKGETDVAEDMSTKYYGKRGTQWMRLEHTGSGHTVLFVNHHGPLSVNSGGICGGEATAGNLLKLMTENAEHGDLVILVGDFNANAASQTIQSLWSNLVHVYNGDSFGGVDNIFTNADRSAVVSTTNLGSGGSDHNAIAATIRLGPPVVSVQSVDLRHSPHSAVEDLTGAGASGEDWSVFWCGKMDTDVEYVVQEPKWTRAMGAYDPDACCRECQRAPECKAFFFKEPSAGGQRCVLTDGQVVGRREQPGWVSGMPAVAAAAVAKQAAWSAASSLH